jgi:hypothetical protein
MKTIVFLLSLIISFVSVSRTIPKSCTKEEKRFVKQILERETQELVEIIKGPNTNDKIVIEFVNKMYVLDGPSIMEVWQIDDEDWYEIQMEEPANTLNHSRLPSTIYIFDESKHQQRIEIQPINGTPSWYLYYEGSFFDPTINATIYYNDDAKIIVGEDFALYEDSLDTWWFDINISPCNELVEN